MQYHTEKNNCIAYVVHIIVVPNRGQHVFSVAQYPVFIHVGYQLSRNDYEDFIPQIL